jgi:hypothetical protein
MVAKVSPTPPLPSRLTNLSQPQRARNHRGTKRRASLALFDNKVSLEQQNKKAKQILLMGVNNDPSSKLTHLQDLSGVNVGQLNMDGGLDGSPQKVAELSDLLLSKGAHETGPQLDILIITEPHTTPDTEIPKVKGWSFSTAHDPRCFS